MSKVPIDGGVVVITGASSGIGAALARLIAPRARCTVLVARRQERLETLAAELAPADVRVLPCDLADAGAVAALVQQLLDEHGAVDVLVNCAGLGDIGLFHASEPAKLASMLDVNVRALTMLTRGLLPGMVERGRGGVLNVSSGFGLTWLPFASAYAASKHYVSVLTEALRAELAGSGVVLTHLCPGPVATEFEAVAGNPTGQSVPGFVELDADTCARRGLAGFEAGRARVLPSHALNPVILLGASTPTWLLRLVYGLFGRLGRPRLEQ